MDPVEELRIADIVQHRAFQVRDKLNPGTIERYAAVITHGDDIEPVVVARIVPEAKPGRGRTFASGLDIADAALVLVAGYHRVAAHRQVGRHIVRAVVREMTIREALRVAATSNLTHGLPLRNKEVRTAFLLYVRGGGYRKADGSLKSLRELGKEFCKSHHTIVAWMKHGKLYWLLKQHTDRDPTPIGTPSAPLEDHPMQPAASDVQQALTTARKLAGELSPTMRWEIAREAEALLAKLKELPMEQPAF